MGKQVDINPGSESLRPFELFIQALGENPEWPTDAVREFSWRPATIERYGFNESIG